MDRITQEACHRQRVLKWAEKHGVTEAAIRYKLSRKTMVDCKIKLNTQKRSIEIRDLLE